MRGILGFGKLLRGCDFVFYLKLRKNIDLDGDITLAENEIKSFFQKYEIIGKDCGHIEELDQLHIHSNQRDGDVIGFLCYSIKVSHDSLVKLCSFFQEIWTDEFYSDKPYCYSNGNYICIIPLMAMGEFLSQSSNPCIDQIYNITRTLAMGETHDVCTQKIIDKKNTSMPHVHQFHTYKAKFFPRFVKSLIVSNIDLLQCDSVKIYDPFVGSGTTLVECSLMGIDSYGSDIDPLSCLISRCKTSVLVDSIDSVDIIPGTFEFPQLFQKKFDKPEMRLLKEEYETEINTEIQEINRKDGMEKLIHAIALSDALTRKFNIRMVGTGCGRFALEIKKTSLQSLIESGITRIRKEITVVRLLISVYNLMPGKTSVICEDSKGRSCDQKFDLIITSPPYIPASSGREDYLVGKAISMRALGLMDDSSLKDCAQNSIGTMSPQCDIDMQLLPPSVNTLCKWLERDELRKVKAKPIAAYYMDIRNSLIKDKKSIQANGKIIYIIGKSSVFYNYKSRQILYTIECDKIFKEIAESVGLRVVKTIDVELQKRNKNARPRSTDQYYEVAIVMEPVRSDCFY